MSEQLKMMFFALAIVLTTSKTHAQFNHEHIVKKNLFEKRFLELFTLKNKNEFEQKFKSINEDLLRWRDNVLNSNDIENVPFDIVYKYETIESLRFLEKNRITIENCKIAKHQNSEDNGDVPVVYQQIQILIERVCL